MILKRFLPFMAGIALFCCALPVLAASTLAILSSGNGNFVLQGEAMENVAALDISITYDSSTLSNPRVTSGGLISGALMAVNPNVPGTVRLGIITTSTIQGSGIVATLAFDRVGNSPGRIIAIKASIANSKGNPLPVQARIVNPSGYSDDVLDAAVDQGTRSNASISPAPSSQQAVIAGLVPSGEAAGAQIEEPSAVSEGLPEPANETEVVFQETASRASGTEQTGKPAGRDKQIYTQKSILETFREYKGEGSVKAFIALFDRDPLIGFTQAPPVALSDGKTTVNIFFIAMPAGKKTPAIKVKGAAIISLKKDPDNTNMWIAELRPHKDALSAILIVFQEKTNMEFPIIVAPTITVDLDKSGTLTEADFKLFLRDRGTAQKPKFDLNGDGKRDFLDTYIFTANYLKKNR